MPEGWQPWFGRFDEIWVPSTYVAHCLATHSPVPVVNIPAVVGPPAPHPSRAEMQMPDGPFLFLCMFDELSGFERKNALGMIEAFHLAFPQDDGTAGLVVKARSLSTANLERLRAAARGRTSISFRVGEIRPDEIAGLIAGCDAFLSLHRSEGFGLVMADAMRLAKPVIATGYSGNLDFMTAETGYLASYEMTTLETAREAYPAGTQWAEPDLDHAARLMRAVAAGKDIVVPRCTLADGRDYDLNSFRFDPARGPAENPRHLVDGIYQPPRGYGRAYLGDIAGEPLAPIDSVGGTALLIRADLHREGLNFPAFSHRGYIGTEGLAMMAKDMGYKCWALPDLRIVHVSA